MSFVQDTWDDLRGKTAAQDAKAASEAAAQGQEAGLEYLKEKERPISALDLASRNLIAGELGINPYQEGQPYSAGGPTSLVDSARQSPLYAAIMGTQRAGEEAIARNASATGGLRGGATIGQLAGFGKDLENQALLQSYNQQLGLAQNLMGGPSLAPQIAQTYGNIGQTRGQGLAAASQARQTGFGNLLGGALSLGGAALGGPVGAALGGIAI